MTKPARTIPTCGCTTLTNPIRGWCAGSTVDLSIPLSYELPSASSPSRSVRRMEDDHAAVFEMAENLLSKYVFLLFRYCRVRSLRSPDIVFFLTEMFYRFGFNGKACILKSICELAESRGLNHHGLLGRAVETLLL